MLVGAGADETQPARVLIGAFMHEPGDGLLACAFRNRVQRDIAQARIDLVEQIVDAGHADRVEHGLDIVFGMRDEGHDLSALERGCVCAVTTRT